MAKIRKLSAEKFLSSLTRFATRGGAHLYESTDILDLFRLLETQTDWELVDSFTSARYYKHSGLLMGLVLHHEPTDSYVMVRWDHDFELEGKAADLWEDDQRLIINESTPGTTIRLKPRQGSAPARVRSPDGEFIPTNIGDEGLLVGDPCGRFLWIAPKEAHVFNPDTMTMFTYWPGRWTKPNSNGMSDPVAFGASHED